MFGWGAGLGKLILKLILFLDPSMAPRLLPLPLGSRTGTYATLNPPVSRGMWRMTDIKRPGSSVNSGETCSTEI